jgi:hypothetical protein
VNIVSISDLNWRPSSDVVAGSLECVARRFIGAKVIRSRLVR